MNDKTTITNTINYPIHNAPTIHYSALQLNNSLKTQLKFNNNDNKALNHCNQSNEFNYDLTDKDEQLNETIEKNLERYFDNDKNPLDLN